jgi:hypothetical protein
MYIPQQMTVGKLIEVLQKYPKGAVVELTVSVPGAALTAPLQVVKNDPLSPVTIQMRGFGEFL